MTLTRKDFVQWLRDRPWCDLWGCNEGRDNLCRRCGTHLYDNFVCEGRLIRLQVTWWRFTAIPGWVRRFLGHRCEVCDKRMFLSGEYCCSKDCYDNWLPF